jgi:hypothetical protein
VHEKSRELNLSLPPPVQRAGPTGGKADLDDVEGLEGIEDRDPVLIFDRVGAFDQNGGREFSALSTVSFARSCGSVTR